MISFEAWRKGAVFCLGFLILSVALQGDTGSREWRTWVSPNGAEIEAYLKKVLPEGIVIVRRDGQEFTAPLERFSEADRAYVAEWTRQQLPSARKFRDTDFGKVELPQSHDISGVEQVRPGSGEPMETAAVRMVLNFHEIGYDGGLAERIKIRERGAEQLIPTRDLANALQGLPLETEVVENALGGRRTGAWASTLNAIKTAISLDLPVIIGHRPDIEEDTREFVLVATGYDRRNLRAIDPAGSRQTIRLDLRDLEETLVYGMVVFPTFETAAAAIPLRADQLRATPEFLSRVSAAIREVPIREAPALAELLREKGIQATLQDINRTDLREQLGRTRSFARQGGIPQIDAALEGGRVVVVPQEYEGGNGFALIYDRAGDDFAAVEFFPDRTFNRGTLSSGDLARRWITRDDRVYRLDLVQIAVPPPADSTNTRGTPPRSSN